MNEIAQPTRTTSQRRRLLIVGLATEYGGTETYIVSLTKLLRDRAEIHVVCANETLADKLEALGVPLTRLKAGSGLAKIPQIFQALMTLIRRARAGDVDTVLVNGYSEIGLLPVAQLLGVRAVATRHLSFDVEYDHWWDAPDRYLARLMYQVLAPSASRIIAVSEAVARDVRRHCPISEEDLVVIPNWVDQNAVSSHAREESSRQPLRLLYVGRLVEFKGLGTLLKSLRRITEQRLSSTSVHLDVVGAGPDLVMFEALAEGLPVTFHGMRNDVPTFYEAADIFVNPSIGPEGMPLVTLEAMARALPCVLSDLPVHLEIAGDGIARMFSRHSEQDLTAQLLALIEDPGLRRQMSERSLARIEARHVPAHARDLYSESLALSAE